MESDKSKRNRRRKAGAARREKGKRQGRGAEVFVPTDPTTVIARLEARAETSLLRRHPWVFRSAIKEIQGHPEQGATIELVGPEGEWLARGAWSAESQIAVRVWTFDSDEVVDREFFRSRLDAAIRVRSAYFDVDLERAGRLVNAESDGLPGVVIDRYADCLVCQFLTAGAEAWRGPIVEELQELLPAISSIYERSDVDVREKEGLPQRTGLLAGSEPPQTIQIVENGYRLQVDVRNGHKTGFYLDQRGNRAAVADLASGRDVLNCFSYTGGFGVAAMRGGAARVINVDASAPALELARQHAQLNELDMERMEFVEADVFKFLRGCRDARREFDLIILDPPKFAANRNQIDQACRGYKDINLLAFKLLRPGGLLVTYSCSGHIGRDLFQKVVADAALDARRNAVILEWLSQADDHSCNLAFPEGFYLKGLVCRVDA
ncbi:MAG: 23S rRNA (cytosine(1962)-C(5))-methyltransferase RlmI [Desulfuromonas sp.]|nr:MAG: 23S rRNA (cytosine(1962)-C(5))-methyltransferase RlmI [Desulfuromonas sp.]